MKTTISSLILVSAIFAIPAMADDLTGTDRLLCAASDVRVCDDDGCSQKSVREVNVPRFVDIDLTAKTIRTTEASGEDRVTPIEREERNEGLIMLQGGEFGRAYSFSIDESSGNLTAAVAARDLGVVIFGSCTPYPTAD